MMCFVSRLHLMTAAFVLMRVRQEESWLFVRFNTIQRNNFSCAADRTQGRGKPGTEREAEDAKRV